MQRKIGAPIQFGSHSLPLLNDNQKERSFFERWLDPWKHGFFKIFALYGVIIFILGFLLGRALILEELAPFAVAYFAVVYHIRRDKVHFAFLGLLAGSLFSIHPHGWLVFLTILCFILLQRFAQVIGRGEMTYVPFLVPAAAFLGGMAHLWLGEDGFTPFGIMMRGVEAILAMVLTFIFIQSLPLFLTKRSSYQLKQEEVISILILLASVMTGTVGWVIEGFSIEHIFTRYFILLLAFVGGGAMGATVGVITGLILSLADVKALAQMSLLGFSGLLAGLFREGKKLGVSLGLLMGISILTVYTGERTVMWISFFETLLAIGLFLVTPQTMISEISKFIPGTKEHIASQQEYMRRVRDLTAERVLQFSNVFRQLSNSFAQTSLIPENLEEVKTDYFLSGVTDRTCQHCFQKEKCWSKQFDYTYRQMREMSDLLERQGEITKRDLATEWRSTCQHLDKLIEVMTEEHTHRKQQQQLNQKIKETRHLVADQLYGVARVMADFSEEIQKEGKELGFQERQILEALEGLGLKVQRVEILSLEPGKTEIRISQPDCSGRQECAKVIAPLISDILGEHIVVSTKGCSLIDGHCHMQLVSGKDFEVTIGMAHAAKGGGLISGDSYATQDLGNGKYAVALSDGMGNGARAYTESSATLMLLQQILQSGLDEKLAIKTINSVLSLRSTDEVFSTIDLALIDLHDAQTKFIKIGSAPSYIKHGEQVRSVTAHNLPIGILQDIEIDVVNEKLKPGDLLIMITDGIYEANREVENRDAWLKRVIREIETDDPQEVADLLLERVIRSLHNQILDDMTVVVAKVDRFKPKWSTISIPNMPKLHRSRLAQ